jgi:hypothetical protein
VVATAACGAANDHKSGRKMKAASSMVVAVAAAMVMTSVLGWNTCQFKIRGDCEE